MIDNSKISIAPLNPIAIENLNNSGKVKFSRQKTDESLSAFREGGSHADTFASTVAEDPILRTFFFLASTRTPQFDRKYPILEVIPITLSSNYDITDKIASSFSDKITETRQKREKASKQTTNAFRSISYRLMGLVLKDEAMVKARSKRETEFSQIMDSTIKRHEKELAPIMTGFIDSFKDLSETINFGRIIAFLDVVQTALRNAKILNHAVQLPNKKESLFASLNGLARTDSVKLEIESCCLDCYFKYNDDP
ncbi:MAG: hypothetical protein JRN67_01145, partial [Nitrososphaerota archaeon]|nr:hypothetical protein [Nitrososphaerota archaeon]